MKKFAVLAVMALAVVSVSGVFANGNMSGSDSEKMSIAGEDTVEVDSVAQDVAMIAVDDTVK